MKIFIVLAILNCISFYFIPNAIAVNTILIISILLFLGTVNFFRFPNRVIIMDDNTIIAPADGKIVVIEETEETEYFNDRRIQVSIFMNIFNVHINWFPVSGTVDYSRHHHGLFLVAWHPKSSEDNERTTTVVDMGGQKIMFRQIAGMVARRIVSYARVGHRVEQNSQCGFIKFGSRVDLFLPLDADIRVKLGDKVVGTQTLIARLKKQ